MSSAAENNQYTYCRGNRLQDPETYSYSAFGGEEFLRSFFEVRRSAYDEIKAQLKDAQAPEYDDESEGSEKLDKLFQDTLLINEHLVPDLNSVYKVYNDTGQIPLTHLMINIIHILRFHQETLERDEIKRLLDIFTRKFEIFKRLFTEYTLIYTKSSNDYTALDHYIVFSSACLHYHANFRNLKFLNTSLKVNDLVCSVKDAMNERERIIFLHTLKMERKLINELLAEKEIVIW